MFFRPPISVRGADDYAAGLNVQVEMGLAGTWKVGYATRSLVSIASGSQPIQGRLEVLTCDGDGVPVLYENRDWQFQLAANSKMDIEACVKHGRSNRPISFRLVDSSGQLMYERS
ncbi:MAG: hypothetical protein ABL921_29150, partial [Pirellula sp.]